MAPAKQASRSSRFGFLTRGRWAIASVALILAIIFVTQNNQRIRIHFVFFTVSSRLWIGFIVSLALGALVGQAVGAVRRR